MNVKTFVSIPETDEIKVTKKHLSLTCGKGCDIPSIL